MKRASAAFAIILALACANVRAATPIYPPEVRDHAWFDLKNTDEPPLWISKARGGFQSRIRLSIAGISTLRVVIRLDQRTNGRARGRLAMGMRDDMEVSDFWVSSDQMDRLGALIRDAKLWQIYPEFYVMKDKNAICLDGEELAFERVNADGYRYSNANAQCGAPEALLVVAREMIHLAHADGAEKLLD